jgi:anaerobic ribonucleoside-triphosphate reductase
VHIHNLSTLSPYTYFGKEVIIAKDNGEIKVTSFEKLYNSCNEPEEVLSKKDDAYAKYPKNLYVLDKNGWTKVTRLVRKTKNRDMYFIKNRGGRSVIVTDNHPMITEEGEKQAITVKEKEDKLFTADLRSILENEKEKLFYKDYIDLFKEIKKRGWLESNLQYRLYFNSIPIEEFDDNNNEDGYLQTFTEIIERKVKLDKDFGYFVGFAIAEGYASYDKYSYKISMTQKDRKPLEYIGKTLAKYHVSAVINKKTSTNIYVLTIKNRFMRFLFEKVFNIEPGSRTISLPENILTYNKEFVKGIIAGIIDGDGSIDHSKTTLSVRIASRTALEQLAVVMQLLGYTPRDRNIEGEGSEKVFKGKVIHQNFPIYGISFRKIDEKLDSFKYRKASMSTKAWQDEGVNEWHQVLNKEKTSIPDDYIYDITTESHTLIVNGMWNHNCVGWDLEDLIKRGFGGPANKTFSTPAKHLSSILGQMVNFLFTLQNEAAGAVAFSSFDTLLAPFVYFDKLSYKEVKQQIQEFVYNMNQTMRTGGQSPFSNITVDLEPHPMLKDRPVIVAGKEHPDVFYRDMQKEMNMINKALFEVFLEGDGNGRPFTFPIPTINITKDFNWDNPELGPLWEATRKYGIPYFANFINSDLRPEDARSMCCRLRLNTKELRSKGGGLFGANPLTGSIGVITINLPRLAYLANKDTSKFYEMLDDILTATKDGLEEKRKALEHLTDHGLYPYSRIYLEPVKTSSGEWWNNHFGTIGIIGMNEALQMLLGVNMGDDEGIKFATEVMNHIREKIQEYQAETGHMFNLEATPSESTSYDLAKNDKKEFPDIVTAGTEDDPYYTNSTQLPVNYTDDPIEEAEKQEPVQKLYTGGTVVHFFLGEALHNGEEAKIFVKKVLSNFELPYITLTPTFSICPKHGYIPGEHEFCPYCDAELAEQYAKNKGKDEGKEEKPAVSFNIDL